MPSADLGNRGHAVRRNQAPVDDLVRGHLPDQSGQDRSLGARLKRQLGVSYRTAWLLNHKIMCAMAEREESRQLTNVVQMDDAYLGGELSGGTAGRDSENKVPILTAVSLNERGHPVYLKPSSGRLHA